MNSPRHLRQLTLGPFAVREIEHDSVNHWQLGPAAPGRHVPGGGQTAQVAIDRPARPLALRDALDDTLWAGGDVTAGEDTRLGGHQGLGIGEQATPLAELDARALGQYRRIRSLADGDHQVSSSNRESAARHRRDFVPPVGPFANDGESFATNFGHAALPPEHLNRRDQRFDHGAFALGGADLLVLCGQPLLGAREQAPPAAGAAPPRRASRIHRRRASAYDERVARKSYVLAEVDPLEEQSGGGHRGEVLTGHAERLAHGRAGCEQDGLVALTLEVVEADIAAKGGVELELHAELNDSIDFRLQHGLGEAVLRDADRHHAAGKWHRLKDGDSVAASNQLVGGAHPGRAGPDDRHPLGPALGGRWRAWIALHSMVCGEALELPDRDRLLPSLPAGRGGAGGW